jgi:hypothetical protein
MEVERNMTSQEGVRRAAGREGERGEPRAEEGSATDASREGEHRGGDPAAEVGSVAEGDGAQARGGGAR